MNDLSPIIEKEILSIIDLGFATVAMREDGLVNTNILIKDSVTLPQSKMLLDAYIKITNGINTPHLFTVTKLVIADKEALEFLAKEANKHGKADAFVIHSLPQKLLGNFYLKIQKPSIPTRFFSSETKAIAWLRDYL